MQGLIRQSESMRAARIALLEEIRTRFPHYIDFVAPQPPAIASVQKHLRVGEALISIYTSQDSSYVWTVPKEGEAQFARVELGEQELKEITARFRKALDPGPKLFGDIPDFDLKQAYKLYSILLKPVEEGWKDTTDLIVVAQGPLGQLPFGILLTEPVTPGLEQRELFGKYRTVPWLIRKVSITRQPSVSSFVTLRSIPEGDPNRKAFVGFGDPVFNETQLAQTEQKQEGQEQLKVRGIRLSDLGSLDNAKITSIHLGMLNRLPDTAEEIKGIANALNADPSQDIFLGKRACERSVKTMDLSNRKVIAFASHALVPGDLDGLDQPAIAFSSPLITGNNEDGLLTMEEVLRLKLNADWVVLSACNTGAAEGAGAEAISGLGRAFFYAGTRAILVSMWPVETTSARKLTTGLFQYQKENKTLSRVRALQKSILALIDSPGLIDDASGKVVASYAHPLFWAPFILVGDGG
jgi:CHAT domain-containing protein